MKWSDSAAIRKQLMRRWRSGALCRAAIAPTECFPMRLPLKQPSARVMLDQFDTMRHWVAELRLLSRIPFSCLYDSGQTSKRRNLSIETYRQEQGIRDKGESI